MLLAWVANANPTKQKEDAWEILFAVSVTSQLLKYTRDNVGELRVALY